MNDIIIHQSIADLYETLGLPIKHPLDFTIHFLPDICKTVPYKSAIFRADYFSFTFTKQGKGHYINDGHRFPFRANTMYFTNPGHTKAYEIDELGDSYIVKLTEAFLRENVHPDIFSEFPFLLAEVAPPRALSAEEYEELEVIYQQIFHHFHKESPYKNRILGNLFTILLLKIKEKCWQCYNPIEEGDRSSQIVKRFKVLLAKHFKNIMRQPKEHTLQVQDLAQELNLHPNYLSNVIKTKTGHSVNYWITKKLTATAKSLLKNYEHSSKEISYSLGFSEPTHFSRFFKKQTGMTPSAYKKSLQPVYS